MDLKEGDKLVFVEQDGRSYVENAALVAVTRVQEAFAGQAERLGLRDEQDVVDLVKQVRRERREQRSAGNG
ncbi:MAG: hypothetical protein LBG60_17430 [Bifidobacteriaceae bacterium]|jgi:hypothetical protein|nr:hypothetical protein [Bifidobacteriaceae bacterium]